MSARDVILARIRSSLADVPDTTPEQDVAVTWEYAQPVDVGDALDVFAQRIADYKATVVRCKAADVPGEISKALTALGIGSVVVPAGLDESWISAVKAAGARLVVDAEGKRLSHAELDGTDAVLTAAAVGAAQTGTIVLDHAADQGRRALSLVPDVHVCVIRADQVVSGVPEAVARLKPSALSGRPLTWISGPSATVDIELSRVEGVHGPRTLYVIIAE